MTQAKPRFTTLDEYAALDTWELPEGNYELVNGEIIELPTESGLNIVIAGFLFSVLLQFAPHYLIRRGTEIFVNGRAVTSRFPDLVVLSEEGAIALNGAKRSAVRLDMPAPKLTIEVVSPGNDNQNRGYVDKREEYAMRGIPEYWIIDPVRSVVIVLRLDGKSYQAKEFRNEESIASPTFPGLNLAAQQILNGGR